MMAAKPKVKFMGRNGGVIHVVTTKAWDTKNSNCSSLKKGHEDGVWKGKGLSPEAALALTGCSRCQTHDAAEAERRASMTPAQKRAESKRRRDETLDKLSGKKSKKVKAQKADKDDKPVRRGPKRTDPESMKAKCEEHAELAKQHGWKATVEETATNEWTCLAKKGGETLKLMYRDGRTVWSRVVLANGTEVRLRNSSNWRKHAAGESKIKSDYTPRQNGGRAAAKRAVIDDNAPRRLSFQIDDDDDTVIEALIGKRITWRSTMTNKLESAVLPIRGRNIRITSHPKSGRRMVSFYEHQGMSENREQLGIERTVYLDKVLAVVGATSPTAVHFGEKGEPVCDREGWQGVIRDDWEKATCPECLNHRPKAKKESA